jgi:hypothetical protein
LCGGDRNSIFAAQGRDKRQILVSLILSAPAAAREPLSPDRKTLELRPILSLVERSSSAALLLRRSPEGSYVLKR